MPYFSRKIEANGLTMNVQIGVSAARQASLTPTSPAIPKPLVVTGIADTGASITCIDPAIIQALGLIAIGKTAMTTPSTGANPVMCDLYDVSLAIYSTTPEPPCRIPTLAVVESDLDHQGFQVLIGRDVLSKCMLIYDGRTGTYTLAF